jgi:hypothetical protein
MKYLNTTEALEQIDAQGGVKCPYNEHNGMDCLGCVKLITSRKEFYNRTVMRNLKCPNEWEIESCKFTYEKEEALKQKKLKAFEDYKKQLGFTDDKLTNRTPSKFFNYCRWLSVPRNKDANGNSIIYCQDGECQSSLENCMLCYDNFNELPTWDME